MNKHVPSIKVLYQISSVQAFNHMHITNDLPLEIEVSILHIEYNLINISP